MSGWSSERLGALCEFDPSKSQVRHLAGGTLVTFMPMNNLGIGGQTVSGQDKRPISEAYNGYTYFADGDVLLAKITPCFENGKLGVAANLENEIGFGSSEFMVLRPGPKISARYLAYYLSQDRFRRLGAKAMTGAVGHKRVPKEWVQDFEIPLPPLADQQRIVAILDEAFEAIAAAGAVTQQRLANTNSLFDSLLVSTFSGLSEQSPLQKLDSLTETPITYGVVKPGAEGSVRFVRGGDIVDGQIRLSRLRTITDVVSAEYRRTLLRGGELLLCLVGQPGQVAVAPPSLKGANIARQVGLIRLDSAINPEYARLFLRSPSGQKALGAKQSGSVQQVINLSELRNVEIPVLPIGKQSEVVAQLLEIAKEIEFLKELAVKKLSLLAELRQSLLARAFFGDLNANAVLITNDNDFATPEQAANILAFMYWRHERANRGRFFGHVMGQKTLDLVERVGRVELGRAPYKDAAGPNDRAHMGIAERWAKQQGFFEFVERSGGGYDFKKLSNYGVMLTAAKTALKPVEVEMARVTDILVGKNTVQAEVFTTALAAWNNLVADGTEASDRAIIYEARENWHPDKLAIPISKFQSAIQEIRCRNLVPDGTAKVVRHRQATLA